MFFNIFLSDCSYPAALSLLSSGALDVKKLITHHFDFNDTEQAFRTAYSKDSKAIKVMIHCDKWWNI